MTARLRLALASLRGQLWLLPALMSAAALALARVALRFDDALAEPRGTDLGWLFSGDVGTARDLLATLLAGLISMTSLVVSLTFVSLTLAAAQLGPRLIGTFIGDRQVQAVLGLFVGTALYLLAVLRGLDATLGDAGVPHLAVTAGSALTATCLLALLFYVHKIARAVIADTVIGDVADELDAAIATLLPERAARTDAPAAEAPPAAGALPPRVGALALGRSGYVRTVDHGALVRLARAHGAVLRVAVRAGDFVLAAGDHVEVLAARPLPEAAAADLRAAFAIGPDRSPAQDLEYPVRQLVEIALRALSPGVNDPFTAMAVVDRLGAALERALARGPPPAALRDERGEARVIAARPSLEDLIDAAFDGIRHAASGQPAVLARLADTLGLLAPALAGQAGPRAAALRHLDRVAEAAAGQPGSGDRDAVLARVERARAALGPGGAPG